MKNKTPKPLKNRAAITAASLLLSIALLYYLIVVSLLPILVKAIIAIVGLLLTSQAIIRANALRQMLGAYLYGSTVGIRLADSLAGLSPRFWNAFADWGIVVSFGIASYFLFKKQISMKMLAFGMISIFGILYLIIPYSSIAFQFINLPQITSHINTHPSAQQAATLLSSATFYLINAVLFVGGFALFILYNLVSYSLSILYGIAQVTPTLLTSAPNYTPINSQAPGVAPILPGITIPLFAGLVALAIILIVHEFSHGILARVAKVKLKEIGLLVLGIIPIGAYVEPDEKQMKKLPKPQQSRILVAGVASNLALSIMMFALLILFTNYLLPGFMTTKVLITATAPNSPAYNLIPSGSQILFWNSHAISNLSSLIAAANSVPFSHVDVATNNGNYSLISNATGKIGVSLLQVTTPIATTLGSIVYFIYIVLSLSFLLNFLVGIVNLLPVPSFDGWQIYQLIIKNKKWLSYLAWITIGSIVVNVLPWIWAH